MLLLYVHMYDDYKCMGRKFWISWCKLNENEHSQETKIAAHWWKRKKFIPDCHAVSQLSPGKARRKSYREKYFRVKWEPEKQGLWAGVGLVGRDWGILEARHQSHMLMKGQKFLLPEIIMTFLQAGNFFWDNAGFCLDAWPWAKDFLWGIKHKLNYDLEGICSGGVMSTLIFNFTNINMWGLVYSTSFEDWCLKIECGVVWGPVIRSYCFHLCQMVLSPFLVSLCERFQTIKIIS